MDGRASALKAAPQKRPFKLIRPDNPENTMNQVAEKAVKEAFAQYPMTVNLEGKSFVIRNMTENDGPALLKFAQELSPHDQLHMRRDITKQVGIDKWIRDLTSGRIFSLVALDGDEIMGYSTINLTDLDWTAHIADMRVSTAVAARKHGLGRLLAREAFNLSIPLGIEKIVVRMTPDQTGARTLFEEMGFKPEALLKDHIKDRNGDYHDLLVMAVIVETFLAQRAAFGVA